MLSLLFRYTVAGVDSKPPQEAHVVAGRTVTTGTIFTNTAVAAMGSSVAAIQALGKGGGKSLLSDLLLSTPTAGLSANYSSLFGTNQSINGHQAFIMAPLPPEDEARLGVSIPSLISLSELNKSAGPGTAKTNKVIYNSAGTLVTLEHELKITEKSVFVNTSEEVMKKVAKSLKFPDDLFNARLSTKEFSYQRLSNGQTSCHIWLEKAVMCIVIAINLPKRINFGGHLSPTSDNPSTSSNAGSNAAIHSSSTSADVTAPSSSSSSSSSSSVPHNLLCSYSRHGNRPIKGSKPGIQDYPIPGYDGIDMAAALWAYCAGSWKMLKVALASTEYIQPNAAKRSERSSASSETAVRDADIDVIDAAVRRVVTAQFGSLRKPVFIKGGHSFPHMMKRECQRRCLRFDRFSTTLTVTVWLTLHQEAIRQILLLILRQANLPRSISSYCLTTLLRSLGQYPVYLSPITTRISIK